MNKVTLILAAAFLASCAAMPAIAAKPQPQPAYNVCITWTYDTKVGAVTPCDASTALTLAACQAKGKSYLTPAVNPQKLISAWSCKPLAPISAPQNGAHK